MRKVKSIFFIFLLSINIYAADDALDDFNKTAKEVLENAYKMFEESKKIIESLTQTTQPVIPSSKDSFMLYYKVVKNENIVKKRNDILIKAQINYKLATTKDISFKNIFIISQNGVVELYGKTTSKEKADKIIDIALKTKGVKEVISYLIILPISNQIYL